MLNDYFVGLYGLTAAIVPVVLAAYSTAERASTVYLADFITLDDERFYVAVDTKTATIRLERVSNDALAQFMKNILFPADPKSVAKKGVAA